MSINSTETVDSTLLAKDLLAHFSHDSIVQTALLKLADAHNLRLHLRGMAGSINAIIAALVYQQQQGCYLFVLHDKEEAAYFLNDLENLLPQEQILFFPTSYKSPYKFEEVENANVLQRIEVLNTINQHTKHGQLIVTYPAALTEKVINRHTLLNNAVSIVVNEAVDMSLLTEMLLEYNFEKVDFVYEAGQFSIRGGIIDIFSYANDLPYRIDLLGDEVDSIRTFDPITQLSVEKRESIAIIPNVQTNLLHKERESFLQFILPSTQLWFKDMQLTIDIIGKYFERTSKNFQDILAQSNGTQIVSDPSILFVTKAAFEREIQCFRQVEFGSRFYTNADQIIDFSTQPQPSFDKNFNLLVENLRDNQHTGMRNVIAAASIQQLARVATMVEELDNNVLLETANLSLSTGFYDKDLKIACYTDHQIFQRFHRYYRKKQYSSSRSLTLRDLRILNIGDFVTHIDYGIGRFGGIGKIDIDGKKQETIRIIYRDDDLLYISIHALHKISRYSGKDSIAPTISKLGSSEWESKKKRAKKKVKDIAKELIELYAKRKALAGFSFSSDSYLQVALESSFLYEDTPDQAKAIQDVKENMEQPHPMDRLICGDVGFGKTEVAIRAAFKAVTDNKQVAVLVPTTILAMQHYRTFTERLAHFPCNIAYINRFKTNAAIKQILAQVLAGKVDILIGTHRITSKDVKFKDLGLLIIDEEQKFGVATKERLKELRIHIDTLTLTATPIPRTLHFSLMGARDLSIIATPPPNRQPVTTKLMSFGNEVIRDAVRYELKRNGQVFFVHNVIKDIEQVANNIHILVPDARLAVAHGQMNGKALEKIMGKFIEHEYDVLVSTNIIESGLDIPNANTIIINKAHTFGLSDLHQMRGRVGRSNKKAYCYLLSPPLIGLSAESRKRLAALEEFSALGDGFKVAMRDLDIRGAGNLLGAEQSGFISDLGFDLYNKILDEAVEELKENEFKQLFKRESKFEISGIPKVDCAIETDLEILIPETYVTNISERLNLYMLADQLKADSAVKKFEASLIDRFGPLPVAVVDLLKTVRLRWLAESLYFEKLVLKNGYLKAYLVEQLNQLYYQSKEFGKVLAFVKKYPSKCRLKETKKRVLLQIEDTLDIDAALFYLNMMTAL